MPTLVTLATFDQYYGSDLILDPAGDLFGVASPPSYFSGGSLFEMAKTATGYAGTPATLATFPAGQGTGGLLMDAAGDLFGTTSFNGFPGTGAATETIFEYVDTGGTLASTPTTLYSVTTTNGAQNVSISAIDAAGDLFGTDAAGMAVEFPAGPSGYGATPIVLANVGGETTLALDGAGNLFGTTYDGGPGGEGTVFELARTATGYAAAATTIASFGYGYSNGGYVGTPITFDSAGDLFGTTQYGGVFELAKTPTGYAGTATSLGSFNGVTGSPDYSDLVVDAAGDVFGTTYGADYSPSQGYGGTVFEIANTATGYTTAPTVLASFAAGGPTPQSILIADAAGDLFGTTVTTSYYTVDTIYELTGTGFVAGPLISGTGGTRTTNDKFAVAPFAGVAIADGNYAARETVSVALSAAANGTLTNPGPGSYDAATGVYTATGTPEQISAALDGLVFVPTNQQVAVGQTVTTGFALTVTNPAGAVATDNTTGVVATAVAPLANNADGTSTLYTVAPLAGILETISVYGGANASGAKLADIVDFASGGSLVYTYAPAAGATETISAYAVVNGTGTKLWDLVDETNGTSLFYNDNPGGAWTRIATAHAGPGATGTRISDVADGTDGTSWVLSYNPSASVTEVASHYSGPDGTGTKSADVIDNTDGTSVLVDYYYGTNTPETIYGFSGADGTGTPTYAVVDYALGSSLFYTYNPIPGVVQAVSFDSAANGSGIRFSETVDHTDGTSLLYNYQNASGVAVTVQAFSGPDASGVLLETIVDYTAGGSAVTTYHPDGTGTTVDYSGPDGTGVAEGTIAPTGSIVSTTAAAFPNVGPIAIAGSGQTVDPGPGSHAIQFVGGAANDSLVLHSDGSDTISGFDPSAGDTLSLSALLAEANVAVGGDIANLANYISVVAVGGAAAILFDPTGQGGGTLVATIENGAGMVARLQTMRSFVF